MLYWTWRHWLSEPGRAGLTAFAFASVLALSAMFDGLFVGILEDLRAFPASLPSDLVAIEEGNTYFSLAPSNLPQLSRMNAEEVPGVMDVQPLKLAPFIFRYNGLTTPAMLVAFDLNGGPQQLRAGRAPTPARDIVLDSNLARRHAADLGDPVVILDHDLNVVGLSEGTSSAFTSYAFITYDRLIDLAIESELPFGTDEGGLVSALLINLEDGADIDESRQLLEAALPEADLFTPAELGDAEAVMGRRMLGPIFLLIQSITWLITLLTMAMLRYAEVQSHLRQFGIHKALGVKPTQLVYILTIGGALTAVLALPLAAVIAKGLSWMTSTWNPLYVPRVWDPQVLARTGALAILGSVAGSLIPLRRLVRLDPVLVFQR